MAHAYLSGNRAPVTHQVPPTPCGVLQGTIPEQLTGGIYVRNGSNPAPNVNTDNLRPYHMFDGDGMLAGVYFDPERGPLFTSRWLQTDVLTAAARFNLSRPTFPSITTLIDARVPQLIVLFEYVRCILVVAFTWLLALWRKAGGGIARISVANTAIIWWDRRALATCESGPPMRVGLPQLDTRGWWLLNGALPRVSTLQSIFQLKAFFQEWTTAHPHIDPETNEFVAFHASFFAPYLYYTVLQPSSYTSGPNVVRMPIPGISSPRMMHDFGVTPKNTLILDFPLSLDILPSVTRQSICPSLTYDPSVPSRIGVLPRYAPEDVVWYELERPGGCVFHTSNAWDAPQKRAVEMLVSRMGGPALVYAAGALPAPTSAGTDECLLYYYRLPLFISPAEPDHPRPSHAFPLLSLPFEFSTLHPARSMHRQRYVWGCSFFDHPAPGPWDPYTTSSQDTSEKTQLPPAALTGYSDVLSSGFKVDTLLKIDSSSLIARGLQRGDGECAEPVETRTAQELWDAQEAGEETGVRMLRLPEGCFAQEVTFVPRHEMLADGHEDDEDDGWLLTYVFDERQLEEGTEDGCQGLESATSELWIIDARTMNIETVCRLALPQRVPYGLHGEWFGADKIAAQEP